MSLNSRLRNLFPEYSHGFTHNPTMSPVQAYNVIEMFCNERGLNVTNISRSELNDFIDVIRHAPSGLSTSLIAERTGAIRQTSQPRRVVARNIYRQIGESVQGLSNIVTESDFDMIVRTMETDISRAINQEVEAVRAIPAQPTSDQVQDLDFWSNPQYEATPIYYTSRPTQKKKRTRSEIGMVREIVRGENFPRPNFKDWEDRNELDRIYDDWNRNVEYREHWIFSRREREGFNRRNVGQFSLDDVMARLSKRKKPHALDSSFSKFYDWKLGGTDWILRLELFQHEQYYFLIVRHIHKPTDTEIKFDVRYWSEGSNQFKIINSIWTEFTNREDRFERVFGSSNPDSPHYIPPYEDDEDGEGYFDDEYEGDEPEEWDEGDTY